MQSKSRKNQGKGRFNLKRSTNRFASKIMARIPVKIAELTIHVDPNNKDKLVTPRVSMSKKPAPIKNNTESKSDVIVFRPNARGVETKAMMRRVARTVT